MSDFKDYANLAAGNADAPPDGAPEGMTRSSVNNVIREMMAAQRRDWEGTAVGGGEWRNPIEGETLARISATQIRVVGVDATAFFPVGRKLKITHATGNPVYCFVSVSAFGTDTDITVENFDDIAPDDEIRVDADGILFNSGFGGGHGIKSGAFEDAGGSLFEVPTALTSTAIQTAITNAQSNGKIVLLAAGTYNVTSKIIITGSVQIWGRSWSKTFLTAQNNMNQAIIEISGGASTNVILRDFTINGNKANQAAGSGIHCTSDNMYGLLIEGMYMLNCYACAIKLTPAADSMRYVTIRDTIIDTPGEHGVEIQDPDGSSEYINIDGCTIVNPGLGGSGLLTACGLLLDGKVKVSNCTVAMDQVSGSHTGSGIRLEQADVSATPSTGANASLVTNCRVTGGSAVVRGIFVGGSANVIDNCEVSLASTAFPLYVEGRGSGTERAVGNIVSGCRFIGGTKSIIGTNNDKNVVQGCLFTGSNTVALEIQSGATLAHVTGNKFQSNTADITDAAASSIVDGNIPQVWTKTVTKTDGDFFTPGAGRYDVTGMTAITAPGLGANGTRKFKVWVYGDGYPAASAAFELYVGATGTIADTLVHTLALTQPGGFPFSFGPIEVTPPAGGLIGLAIYDPGAAGATLYATSGQPLKMYIEKVVGT